LELLEWVAAPLRTYDDVREAWRSNCPRHAVWDDAVTAEIAAKAHRSIQMQDGRLLQPAPA